MADYIKRRDIFDVISIGRLEYPECGSAFDGMETEVRNIPSADVAEVKHGEWEVVGINTYELSYGGTAYEPFYRCSKCKMITESYLRLDEPIMPEDASFPNFCQNCGADMRKDGGT